jgi:trehalose 6-phosphate phosphatase
MTVQPASEELVDALIARLERARSALLMLDYDGTLAPFHVDPAQARPYPGVTEVLDAIMHDAGTRVVLISGRRAGDLRVLLGVRTQPEVWGSHGWERLRPNGALSVERVPQIALDALITASQIADRAQRLGGRLERKPSSIALHWRGLPQERVSQLRAVVKNDWNALCRTAPLALLEFDGGLELRVTGRTKADAALAVLGECERDTPAAFLGDDTTDEDAFAAIQGRGLAVLVRPQLRPTAAQVWLQPPHELIAFLQRWQRARETHASGAAQ